MALMSRWEGIRRPYTTGDVNRLKGSVKIEHTLARNGANKLWDKFKNKGTYTFNRGSAAVNKIEGNFKRVKKNE